MSNESDDVFHFSITELLLLITFALLIAMVSLVASLKHTQNQLFKLEKAVEQINSSAHEVVENLRVNPSLLSKNDADLEPEVTSVEELFDAVKIIKEALGSDSAKSVLKNMPINDVWSTLAPLVSEKNQDSGASKDNAEIQACYESFQKEKKIVEKIMMELDEEKNLNSDISNELSEAVSELKDTIIKNKDLSNQVYYYSKRSSNGRVLPPCWATENGQIEYTYYLKITNHSILVNPIFSDNRMNSFMKIMGRKPEQLNLSFSDFNKTMRPFLEKGDSSDPVCRFYVKIEDNTSPSAKPEYKEALRNIESIFYKYLIP